MRVTRWRSVKAPYTAAITVPAALTALMSALHQSEQSDGPTRTFFFEQVFLICQK
jgi:hypothetical protein